MSTHTSTIPPVSAPELGLPDPIQPLPNQPRDLEASDDTEKEAYERGAEAGKREEESEKNPYPEGSELAKAFEHGYLDGQKVRSNDKPPEH
ncbi:MULTISPECIES: Sf3a2-prov protein [Rhizobium]|uniref:Sf3a2-prov protein n=1 Tax=Rhizobium TaxID=379 RepID=UPI00195CCFD0|nr:MULTISPECIES: Sf3a2-prov protein [Rhizobium]MBM7047877.1 Sf3a2-prov protein [Rhizobium lusitanum]